jgi:aminoglycoside/choline kinase family phosphotransferase/dTDP-glucose pyrophosphorylase
MRSKRIRTAFIPGAGLGTRLRPLTDNCPKPLLSMAGRPMITYAMDHLMTVGIERFIVNTHHCPDAYSRTFPDGRWRGVPITFRHEPVLLDTAGGLKNIENLLEVSEAILVYNGDIMTDLPLERLLDAHAEQGREVTLALRSSGPVQNVDLDARGAVCDMRRILGRPGVQSCQFTGVYVVERRFLDRLQAGRIESVVPVFAGMIRQQPGSVGGIVIDDGFWHDIGQPDEYERINRIFASSQPSGKTGGHADDAEAFVRHALGLAETEPVRMSPLSKGGSNRSYRRIRYGGDRTAVLMQYQDEPVENRGHAAIASFLQGIGVTVPRLIHHDAARRCILMEDLGDRDLWSCRVQSWTVRQACYQKALSLVHRLHAFPPADFPSRTVPLMERFGPDLYRWERDYFRDHFVQALCGLCIDPLFADELEGELSRLAERLEKTGHTLIHRDFQSQNIMIRSGEPVLIDFQGMRFGSFFYDLGSLLYDPYVFFTEGERLALLRHHYERYEKELDWPEYQERFREASAQRLMQALGAYGFLGLKRGRRDFLAHADSGLSNLIDASTRAKNLQALRRLALECRTALRTRQPVPDDPLTG